MMECNRFTDWVAARMMHWLTRRRYLTATSEKS